MKLTQRSVPLPGTSSGRDAHRRGNSRGRNIVGTASLVLLLLCLDGCSSAPKRPVLYPNNHLSSVGQSQASRDINECMHMAGSYGVAENRDGEIGKKAVGGAAVGGATAGAWGAVSGDAGKRAAAGAAAGAAGGATRGILDSTETNPTFKRFVQKCLSERGYHVIGWE